MTTSLTPPRRRTVVKVLVVVVLLWVAAVAVVLFLARRSAESGLDRVRAVRRAATVEQLLQPHSSAELRRAESELDDAESLSSNPILAPLHVVPVLGRQLDGAEHLNSAARRSVGISADTLDQLRVLADRRAPRGEGRVQLMDQVNRLARTSAARLRAVDPGSGEGLIAPLDRAHRSFVEQRTEALDGLVKADRLTAALSRFLQGPSRYLLLGANNAEMRAGSGMWLTATTVDADAGTLRLGEVRPTDDLVVPKGTVPVTDPDLARNWNFLDPGHDFRQLALTPRFAVSAELASRLWAVEPGGSPVDGVMVVDIDGVRAMLRAVGPVTVGDVTYTATNLRQKLLHEQYATGDQQARKDALGDVARATFDKLEQGGWRAADLAGELSTAVQGRHLLVWSSDPVEQRGWEAASLDGRVQPTSLAVSLLNRGGNKLDAFVDQAVRVTTRPVGANTRVTVQVDLANHAPGVLPPYVAGGPQAGAGLAPGEYGGILVANVPAAAGDVTIDGGEYLALAGPDGDTQARGVFLTIPPGGTSRVTVAFVMAGRHGSLVLEPTARIPGTVWSFGDRTFKAEVRRTVRW